MSASKTSSGGGPAQILPTLEEMQHWTAVIGRIQQMMMEHGAEQARGAAQTAEAAAAVPARWPGLADAGRFALAQADLWSDTVKLWHRFIAPAPDQATPDPADRDRRFAAPEWRDNPLFDLIRQTYLMIANHMLRTVDDMEGIDRRQHDQLRFAARAVVDAMSPSNFALTNPAVLARTIETRGANLITGMERMLADLARGQLSHTDAEAFEVGRNLATTPGKVIRETPLYQLIQYQPTTATVLDIPVVIFPPWINRFYILDLNEEKSFVRWALDQGLSVFMVSWKSADASMAETSWEDYIFRGQLDAIDAVRSLLGVDHVHATGYCVAGTTLAATLALLAARGEADKVASATFLTAQVDFEHAGDLALFVDDEQLRMIEAVSNGGFLDGRYMAATFNLLRGRDLIWNYVINNYLLGQDYPPFDLLHWNGDVTNLPAKWHLSYLQDLYRDNKLVKPGAITIDGTPLDLGKVETPAYVQAGREDHIAPPESVWKVMGHFAGPVRFVLAGSGHIAGVINPPAAAKYQYWTSDHPADTLDAFIRDARETKGSWWPNWFSWIEQHSGGRVPAEGARIPGGGTLPALEDAPGSYVRAR
jgi:polyhydroxyalkanoate synthase subunit PhaC